MSVQISLVTVCLTSRGHRALSHICIYDIPSFKGFDGMNAVYQQYLINSNVMWLNSINFKQTWASKTCLKMQQAALVSKSCYRSVYHFGLNWIYVHFQTKISRHWNLTWYQSCFFHISWTSKYVINTCIYIHKSKFTTPTLNIFETQSLSCQNLFGF